MSESLAAADDCMICFERPSMYGLLQNCNHQFCFECIKQWRKSSSRPTTGDASGTSASQMEQNFINNLRDADIEHRRTTQAAQGVTFDDGAYRDGYRAAIAALEAGTFELGPHAPVNVERAARLFERQTSSMPDIFGGFDEFIEGVRSDYQNTQDPPNMRNTKTCPLCREPSAHIIPAVNFPKNSQEKQHLMNGFYAEKKRILCRDFEASLNAVEGYYCPRYNDCLYAHLKPSEDPNAQVRSEPFTFTAERIKQLRRRRRQDSGNTASFLSYLRATPTDIPLYITERIESLLSNNIFDLMSRDADILARNLVFEFYECLESTRLQIRGYHLPSTTSSTEGDLSDADWADLPVRAHIVRLYEEGILGNVSEHGSTWSASELDSALYEWRASTTERQEDGQIIHHYVTVKDSDLHSERLHCDHLDLMQELDRKKAIQGRSDQEPRDALHMYHIFQEDGELSEMCACPAERIHMRFPTHVEFVEPISLPFRGLSSLTHHFMSPCSVEEARGTILNGPSYLGTRAALDADQEDAPGLSLSGHRAILRFSAPAALHHAEATGPIPRGISGFPPASAMANLLSGQDSDEYDFEREFHDDEDDAWLQYLEAMGYDAYGEDEDEDDNDVPESYEEEDGDEEQSEDEDEEAQMPGLIRVVSSDANTWDTVSEQSLEGHSEEESSMDFHAPVDGDSSDLEDYEDNNHDARSMTSDNGRTFDRIDETNEMMMEEETNFDNESRSSA